MVQAQTSSCQGVLANHVGLVRYQPLRSCFSESCIYGIGVLRYCVWERYSVRLAIGMYLRTHTHYIHTYILYVRMYILLVPSREGEGQVSTGVPMPCSWDFSNDILDTTPRTWFPMRDSVSLGLLRFVRSIRRPDDSEMPTFWYETWRKKSSLPGPIIIRTRGSTMMHIATQRSPSTQTPIHCKYIPVYLSLYCQAPASDWVNALADLNGKINDNHYQNHMKRPAVLGA